MNDNDRKKTPIAGPERILIAVGLALAILIIAALIARGQPYSPANPPILPDPNLTPGSVLTNVSVEASSTIGYANVIGGGARDVPESLKKKVFIEYFGFVPTNHGQFEVDHLVPIVCQGANDISNLWPQAYFTPRWSARVKDRLEDFAAAQVRHCLKLQGHDAAVALLKQFQHEISQNWTNCYSKWLGDPDDKH